MPTTFIKANRKYKQANGEYSDPISYSTSSESVEMTDGTILQTKIGTMDTAIGNKVDKAGGTMTGSIVTTSNTAIKPQTHDTGTVGELNNHYLGGYFNTIHVKGSNANGSYGIELSGANDSGTIEFAKEADSNESYRQVFQNKDGTLALTSDIEVSEDDIASTQTVSGNPVTVTDAYPMNAEDITVDITPVQLGSGTPSPDNIRPIEGRTGAELTQKDDATNPTVTYTYTVNFGQTVFGGKWHVTEGGTDKTYANIANYNGETINEPWLSSMDEYSPGATPTIGAQVVYPLTTPTTINTDAVDIPMLQGINTISASTGDVSLKYQPNNVVGELKGEIQKINSVRPVYGFHIDGNESDPSAAVTYLQDAVGMRPAKMDYIKDVFDYGSWEDVWFVRDCKPCVLHKNGYVISYLDKNDFSKDIYGDPVFLSIPNHQVMIEFPKIWYKVVPDLNDSSSACVYISPVKLDEDYVDFAYIDSSGAHKEHFYMSAYNACAQTESGTRYLCSLSGQAVSKSLTGQNEIDACKALGTGWYTEDAGEIILINFLLTLMGKSLDTKTVFGQGLHTGGSEAINDGFRTGVHNTKGMFYGTNSGAIASNNYNNAVKIFGIENYWGFQWRRYAGDMLVGGHRKIKLCYGNDDGSTTKEFNSTGDGYVDIGCTPSGTSGGYINKMKYTSNGMFSSVSSGTASTYYCSGQWYNNSGTMYAFRGGGSSNGARVGAFFVALHDTFGGAGWNLGASPSYK